MSLNLRPRLKLIQTVCLNCHTWGLLLYIDETGDTDDEPASELQDAIIKFQKTYEKFSKKNSEYHLVEEDFDQAFEDTGKEPDIRQAAEVFRRKIQSVVQTLEKRKKSAETKWTSRLGGFLIKLYPVARLSLGLTAGIAKVTLLLEKY